MRFLRILVVLLVAGFGTMQLQGCTATESRRSAGETMDDGAITAKVKTALLQDEDVSGLAVNVNTYRGVVQLTGFVDDESQRSKAESIAKDVSGVQSVKNDIQIKPKS